jgi:cytochrome P450
VELARNPHVQENLRDELSTYTEDDPTYEDLSSGLPYLDAVVNETLRMHPPLSELNREV